MLKQWLVSEYWRAQGIYEIFRTNEKGIGYTTPKIPIKAPSQDHNKPIFFKPTTYLPYYLPTLK